MEYKKISNKRTKTVQGRYPEWDFYDAMDDVQGHNSSTQPVVVVDTLKDSQVQDTQLDDDLLHDTEGKLLSLTWILLMSLLPVLWVAMM